MSKFSVKMTVALGGLLLLSSITSTAQAQVFGPTFKLSDLIAGNTTVTAGDRTFNNWAYAPTGGPVDPTLITVQAILLNNAYGLKFTASFTGTGTPPPNDLIQYDVTAVGGAVIIGSHLEATTSVSGGNGSAVVNEFLTSTPGGQSVQPRNSSSYTIVNSGGTLTQTQDNQLVYTTGSVTTPPLVASSYSKLHVATAIILNPTAAGTTTSVTSITETFASVPEPGTLVLAAAGGVVVLAGAIRRRRAA